jgi:hypothetical protein
MKNSAWPASTALRCQEDVEIPEAHAMEPTAVITGKSKQSKNTLWSSSIVLLLFCRSKGGFASLFKVGDVVQRRVWVA